MKIGWTPPLGTMHIIAQAAAVFHDFVPAPEGWPFVIIVVCVASAALWRIYRYGRLVRTERRLLASVRALEKPDWTFLNSDIAKRIGDAPTQSLLRRYTVTMARQRNVANCDIGTIMDSLVEADGAALAFPRLAPNLAMLVGLLGTVVGLAHVVQSLGPQIMSASSAGSPQEMAQALAGQFAHLRTAFTCTLWGIGAAVLIAWRTNSAERQYQQLVGAVEEFGMNELSPRILPGSQEAQIEGLKKVLEESREFLKSVSQQLTTAADNMHTQVESLEGTTNRLGETFLKMTEEGGNIALYMRLSAEKLNQSIKEMTSLDERIQGTYAALMQRHDKAEASFEGHVTSIVGSMTTLQKGFNTNTGAIITQLQDAVATYADSASKFQEAGVNFRNMSKEMGSEAYRAFAERAEGFNAALKQHEQSTQQVDASLRELMARLDPRLLPPDQWERLMGSLHDSTEAQRSVASHLEEWVRGHDHD